MSAEPPLGLALPPWAADRVVAGRVYASDADRMGLTIALARENVEHDTGSPFGAAIFERDTGRLVAAGVNSVLRLSDCTLHAEIVAIRLACRRLGSFTLGGAFPPHELVSSCDLCAMCLGAVLWSGVKRVVCGAAREDAERIGFDEGPVFPESWRYLEARGVQVVRGVRRDEARAALELYRDRGPIYNG